MKVIPISQGYFTKVDDFHYERVMNNGSLFARQNSNGSTYAAYRFPDGRVVWLHDFIKGPPPEGFEWDHANRDSLDNQESNLRLATRSQNVANAGPRINNTSGFKGVSTTTRNKSKPWRWVVMKGGRSVACGYSRTKEEAALAWNKAAKEHYGEFAYQNDVLHPNGSFPVNEIDELLN